MLKTLIKTKTTMLSFSCRSSRENVGKHPSFWKMILFLAKPTTSLSQQECIILLKGTMKWHRAKSSEVSASLFADLAGRQSRRWISLISWEKINHLLMHEMFNADFPSPGRSVPVSKTGTPLKLLPTCPVSSGLAWAQWAVPSPEGADSSSHLDLKMLY